MKSYNDQMTTDLEKSKKQFSDLIYFEPDEDYIMESLISVLNKCLQVDNKPLGLDASKFASTSKKVISGISQYGYTVKENRVLQIDLINKQINEIEKLKDLYIPKVMAIDDSNVLLIGGQSHMEYTRYTSIKKTCYVLSNDQGTWKSSS